MAISSLTPADCVLERVGVTRVSSRIEEMAIVVDVASRRCLPMVSDGADGPGLAAASSHLIRFVYSVRSEKVTHHNASFQVFPAGADHCRVVWIADLLPMKRQRVSGR